MLLSALPWSDLGGFSGPIHHVRNAAGLIMQPVYHSSTAGVYGGPRILSHSQEPPSDVKENKLQAENLMTRHLPSLPHLPQDVIGKETHRLDVHKRPRSDSNRIELPSIRRAIPEIDLGSHSVRAQDRHSYSPRSVPTLLAEVSPHTSPVFYSKKRRIWEDQSSPSRYREESFSWHRANNQSVRSRSLASSPAERTGPYSLSYFSKSPWTTSGPAPQHHSSQGLPAMQLSPTAESLRTNNYLPRLQRLPSAPLENGGTMPGGRRKWSEYVLDVSYEDHHTQPRSYSSAFSAPASASSTASRAASTHEHQRGQSYPGPIYLHQQTSEPLSFHAYQESYTFGGPESDGTGMSTQDGANRKRRGNLPKETTDKMRTWFVAHLQHPYPTEDEKQELMRQTGLQMNQISNWFINARRRQLPALIHNARVESDTRIAKMGDTTGTNSLNTSEEVLEAERRRLPRGVGVESGDGKDVGDERVRLVKKG